MHALSLFCVLFTAAPDVRDGTVVVLENSNPVVEAYTKSEITHVGLILNEQGEVWVYEAAPSEVRKLPWESYYEELGDFNRRRKEKNRLRVRLYEPQVAYTSDELTQLKSFLDSQLGRRYSVKGYVRQKPGDGVHCAELVSTALARTGRYPLVSPHTISPATLVARIQSGHVAAPEVQVPLIEPRGSWCDRSWAWWTGLWSWCRWASWESATFCW